MAIIKPKLDTVGSFTVTLTSIATAAGRISTQLDLTTLRPRLLKIWWQITAGAVAPTLDAPFLLYLVGSDAKAAGEFIEGGYGLVDAAVATQPKNLAIIDAIPAIATAGAVHYGRGEILYPPPKLSVLFFNLSGQAISAVAAESFVRYTVEYDESV